MQSSHKAQDCLIGDMKRLWRSLDGQEDGNGGGKGEEATGSNKSGGEQIKQDVIHVMGDMKLMWKNFVTPLPVDQVGQV